MTRQPNSPTIFCYTLTGWPPPATLAPLIESLRESCDGFAVYGSRNNESMNMSKVYEQSEWQKHFDSFFREPMEVIWSRLLSQTAQPYNYYVKVDTDSYVRPCAMRRLFEGRTESDMVVLSTSDNKIQKGQSRKYGTGTVFDGFFVAHSRLAATKMYQLMMAGKQCGAVVLSGHDESPDGQGADMAECEQDITVEFPLDKDGFALISGIDMQPDISAFQDLVQQRKSVCVPAQQSRSADNDDDANMDTPAAKGTDRLCFSHDLALIHSVVAASAETLAQYYKAAYDGILLTIPQ